MLFVEIHGLRPKWDVPIPRFPTNWPMNRPMNSFGDPFPFGLPHLIRLSLWLHGLNWLSCSIPRVLAPMTMTMTSGSSELKRNNRNTSKSVDCIYIASRDIETPTYVNVHDSKNIPSDLVLFWMKVEMINFVSNIVPPTTLFQLFSFPIGQ